MTNEVPSRDNLRIIGTLLNSFATGDRVFQTLWSDGIVTLKTVNEEETYYSLRMNGERVEYRYQNRGDWYDFLDQCMDKDFATRMIELYTNIAFEEHVLGVEGDKPTR